MEIEELAKEASVEPAELINKRSQVFRKMEVALEDLTSERAIELMMEKPRIMIRPLGSDGETVTMRFKEDEYRDEFL